MAYTHFRLVVLESPYAGDVERHIRYARACVRDALSRREAPIASHLLYTQAGILHDALRDERAMGMAAGHAWIAAADAVVAYTDLGVTPGMAAGLREAVRLKIDVDMRTLGPPWSETADESFTAYAQPSTAMLGHRRHRGC